MKTDRKERVAELVAEHGPMVFATAWRILGNPDDAEDALQEVFLKLLGGWGDRLRPEAVRNWGGYLRVAAIRSAVDLLHRKRRGDRDTLPLDEEVAESGLPDPRRSAIERERAGQLREALKRLPKREAHIFALRYFEDYSYEQIAEELGLKVRKVGVLLYRARGRLRKILAPLAEDAEYRPSPSPAASQPGPREKEESHVAG